MTQLVHDAIAAGYNSATGLIAAKNSLVSRCLQERYSDPSTSLDVLDIGVGDGSQLVQLSRFLAAARMTGLDVSGEMLDIARARVPMVGVKGSAEDAASLLRGQSFDLVLAHFVLAYVSLPVLLNQVQRLLSPGGILSLVTTTRASADDGLQRAREHLQKRSWSPLHRVALAGLDQAMARCLVPQDGERLVRVIEDAGLRVVRREQMIERVTFNEGRDGYQHFIVEGWGAHALDGFSRLPMWARKWALRLCAEAMPMPLSYVSTVEVLELAHAQAR